MYLMRLKKHGIIFPCASPPIISQFLTFFIDFILINAKQVGQGDQPPVARFAISFLKVRFDFNLPLAAVALP
jgi:hypothetical protein